MASIKSSSDSHPENCTPLGIETLMGLDRVCVEQVGTAFPCEYLVTTEEGDLIFTAKENSSAVEVMLGAKQRGFYIDLMDTNQQKVISLRSPTADYFKMQVRLGGLLVSVVRREPTLLKPVLSINDGQDKPVLRVKGPRTYKTVCDLDLLTLDKQPIGAIHKKWQWMDLKVPTNADKSRVRFPRDLAVGYKAALIGTCFLMDFIRREM